MKKLKRMKLLNHAKKVMINLMKCNLIKKVKMKMIIYTVIKLFLKKHLKMRLLKINQILAKTFRINYKNPVFLCKRFKMNQTIKKIKMMKSKLVKWVITDMNCWNKVVRKRTIMNTLKEMWMKIWRYSMNLKLKIMLSL
jgi:hypothetical protein